ncbi:MAG: ComEC/Rec2 family competence protein [Terrimicrobiaceae bacterium]|nr:ComEC/Rec2 family competence protein [Terrimicrobiaceae bacterium]
MSRAAFFRQRLPCAGLFLCAAAGVVLGRYVPIPGWEFAAGAAGALVAACIPAFRPALPVGVALTFAAAQAWQYRESPAVRLAACLSESPQSCEAEITVLEAPHLAATSPARRCRFAARLDRLTLGVRELRPGCDVIVAWNGEPPVYGGRYDVRASISNCPAARNPGAFDYTAWLANAGIRSALSVLRDRDARLLGVGGNPVVRFAIASRAWIERTISLGIAGTPEAQLIRAMTIGDTSDAPDSIKDAFRETGTFHLFSVSGLHVGIVAVMLWTLLGACGVSQRRSVLIIIPGLFFYALLTGLSAASVRAAVMLSIIAFGLLLDRPHVPLNSVGAAGLVILFGDTSQLFNSGFQLSFGAVTAIILLAAPLQRRVETLTAPDPFLPARLISPLRRAGCHLAVGTAGLVAVSLSAWLVSLPLIVYYFHLVSLSSIPANLLAVPLSSVCLCLASVALVAGTVSPWLAEIFNQANFLLTKILIFVVQAFASLPGSSIYVGAPQPPGTLATLTLLDAGAGGAGVLLAGRDAWIIDPGSEFFADAVTLAFLRSRGVNHLDAVVLTHGDIKHIGGFDRIAATLHPDRVFDSGLADRSPTRKRILAALAAGRERLVPANAGTTLAVNDAVRLTVLYPPPNAGGVYADDKSLVLRIEAGGFSALLLSDSGLAAEQWLLAHAAGRLPCDVVAMGRHVSGLSGDPDFLRAAHPRILITTVAPFPTSEQIRPQWAQAVRALGIDLIRQDESGAVTLTIRRGAFTVTPFLPAAGPPRIFPTSHAPHTLR